MSVLNEDQWLGAPDTVSSYQIQRSLRFNSSDSAFCSRVAVTPTDATKFTLSFWIKRSKLGAEQAIMYAGVDASNKLDRIAFTSGDAIELRQRRSNTDYTSTTNAVFRDCSAWYHILYSWSSGTRTLYVNGVSQAFASNSTTTATHYWQTSGITQYLGRDNNEGGSPYAYGDFYLADIHFIDGQALTPSSFGQTDANGEWQPIAYTGTYGTNGFKLNFADNSAATAAALGKDTSGNGNNWTPNNLSVTAGAGNDSLVDTPTSYGTDTGAGGEVRGNYCTLNPLQLVAGTLSNGNLQYETPNSGSGGAYGTFYISTGKWYWEFTVDAGSGTTASLSGIRTMGGYYVVYYGDGQKYINGTNSNYGATYTTGDTIGVGLDMDGGTVTFYKNGTSQGAITIGNSDPFAPYFQDGGTGAYATFSVNFGQRPFAYQTAGTNRPASTYKALCDTNLPAPVVAKPSTVMDVKLITANNSTQTISGFAFSPDLVWTKSRSQALSHYLYDTVRGVQKPLSSNGTGAESTITTSLTAFISDGFTVGPDDAANYGVGTGVAWCWDAGSSNVVNTQGTITSTVRANPSAGFSIVSFDAGAGGQVTMGHGLGVAPSLIIVKRRTVAENWYVWNTGFTVSEYLTLNTTAAKTTSANLWGSTLPSSTLFGFNANSGTHIAYCFAPVAGYSAFGSYTGNGSADGPFVYTRFRPRWVLIKSSSGATENWVLIDSARNTYNVAGTYLLPNLPDAEGSSLPVDFLSNGFKLRGSGGTNQSAVTYVYAAFAENPFQYARAR